MKGESLIFFTRGLEGGGFLFKKSKLKKKGGGKISSLINYIHPCMVAKFVYPELFFT